MITAWNELPIKKFIEIHELVDDEDRVLKIAAVLAGISYDEILEMPLIQTRKLIENTEFLGEKCPIGRAHGKYVLNGTTYRFNRELNDVTLAQYLDFQNCPKDLYHAHEMLAIFLIPDGHRYNDGYDMAQVADDILNYLSYEDYNSIAAFFFGSWLILFEKLEKRTMKILKKAKKDGAATEEEIATIKQNLEAIRRIRLGIIG